MVAFLAFLASCSTPSKQSTSANVLSNGFHSFFINEFAESPTGTFYVGYSPAAFPEPTDLREARHANINAVITMYLNGAGLTPGPALGSDYEITYAYHTLPSFGSGYSHHFDITITKQNGLSSPTRVWHGSTTIDHWKDSDISYLFPGLVSELLGGFPKTSSSNTIQG